MKDAIHVVPEFEDEPEHEETPLCWCQPVHDKENQMHIETGEADTELWVHNRRGKQ